ncbi:hypothetical protein C2845_PM05G17890 [Panicum miliaceum]|uniref:Uncharacterized protein n=1 Tax=Panicum miliaceum TaxID=4540 RepID=A0A3L6SVC8_PANMI|nr:hypothetical protein C2845_PM05G17890 [Panicum miliaceum]
MNGQNQVDCTQEVVQHPQEPIQEEVQPLPEIIEIEDDSEDDDPLHYEGYYGGGWVETDTKEEPMELPADHPDAGWDEEEEEDNGQNAAGGGSPDASGGGDADEEEDAQDDDDDGDEDPEDPPGPATPGVVAPEPKSEKEIHYLNFAEGPMPALLWEAMQAMGFPLKPRFEVVRYQAPGQREEWLVSVVITVPDERYGSRREISSHHDNVPWSSVDASEAARRAMSALCHTYREELRDTKFRFFPRRMRGAPSARVPLPPPEERNPTVDATPKFVAALTTDLDAAGVEIVEAREEALQLRREKEILEAHL